MSSKPSIGLTVPQAIHERQAILHRESNIILICIPRGNEFDGSFYNNDSLRTRILRVRKYDSGTSCKGSEDTLHSMGADKELLMGHKTNEGCGSLGTQRIMVGEKLNGLISRRKYFNSLKIACTTSPESTHWIFLNTWTTRFKIPFLEI